MKPLTAAELAAHWATFDKVQTVRSLYGLARQRIASLRKGQTPILPGVELIYHLVTRYPELITQPIRPKEFMALLNAHGVTGSPAAGRLIGKQRHAMLDYLGGNRQPSWQVTNLMAVIQRFLSHRTIDELWAELDVVKKHRPGGELLEVLEQDRTAFQVMELIGVEQTRYFLLRNQSELPMTVAFLTHLMLRYPELQPPRVTVASFDALMAQHGVTSSIQISTLLGRSRDRWRRYRVGYAQPSGPTLALMMLITRFLETHPLSDYWDLVYEVGAAHGFDLTQETWREARSED